MHSRSTNIAHPLAESLIGSAVLTISQVRAATRRGRPHVGGKYAYASNWRSQQSRGGMTSPELTGGAGFTFEDAVGAFYLAALLTGTAAPGLGGRVVRRVKQQQEAAGEPLDDVIVDAAVPNDGSPMRLSLQVKRSMSVSQGDKDFRQVIERSWDTLQKTGFREHLDRVGAAVGTISDEAHRNFTTLCEWARASPTPASFMQRFTPTAGASRAQRAVLEAVRQCAAPGAHLSDPELHRLFAHLVLIKFDLMHEGSTSEPSAIAGLQRALIASQQERARDLWRQLRLIAREGAGRREEFTRSSLMRRLTGGLRFVGIPELSADLQVLRAASSAWLLQQPHDIGGTELDRSGLREALDREIAAHRLTLIKGLPGTGKTVLLRDLLGRCSREGTTLLMTAGRLVGRSWAEHARGIGLSTAAIEPLLVEVAATGRAVLFIDGLDRIVPEQRGVISDLLGEILANPMLSQWCVVATARDAGIEPLRNWIPAPLMGSGGVGYVDVENLSQEEADALGQALPALRPLLQQADERVRACGIGLRGLAVRSRAGIARSPKHCRSWPEKRCRRWSNRCLRGGQSLRQMSGRYRTTLRAGRARMTSGLATLQAR